MFSRKRLFFVVFFVISISYFLGRIYWFVLFVRLVGYLWELAMICDFKFFCVVIFIFVIILFNLVLCKLLKRDEKIRSCFIKIKVLGCFDSSYLFKKVVELGVGRIIVKNRRKMEKKKILYLFGFVSVLKFCFD